MFSIKSHLNFARTLGSQVMLGVTLFFCSSYAQAAAQVTLAWDASTSPGVAGYEISYGQTSGTYATQVDVGNQTSYTVKGLNDGAIYYFAAKAYNSGKTTWSGFSTQVSATIPSGPVAAYNFAEVSGSKVIDASGKGNHGTLSGPSRITQGRFGKALSFDGLNDWVTVNDAASLDLTTGMTLEAWVYPTESMTGWRTLVIKESPPPDLASYYLYANSDTDQPDTGAFIGSYQDLRGGPGYCPTPGCIWLALTTAPPSGSMSMARRWPTERSRGSSRFPVACYASAVTAFGGISSRAVSTRSGSITGP